MHSLVIFVAKYFIVLSVGIAAYAWWQLNRAQKKAYILLAIVAGILSLLFAKASSKLYYDPRPFITGHFTPYFPHGNDNGFPSDHTLLSSFLAWLTLCYSRRLGWLMLLISVLIGGARVIARVHHVTDVVGAIMLSGAAVWLSKTVLLWLGFDRPPVTERPRTKAP